MLSYRHAFHAGNFADVLKHCALTLTLDYVTQKEKGFYYIDSHSGAGMYSLNDPYAEKTGEYKEGIAKIINGVDAPEAMSTYLELIKSLNDNNTSFDLYPGSPGIAKEYCRRQDSAHLFELHPTDKELLESFSERWRKSHVYQKDGYQGVLSLLPPPTRRAVVLIDPPYEIKDDYTKAVQTIIKAYKRFNSGIYMLWYPVVKRALIDQMAVQFAASDVKNVLQLEFCQKADSDEYGMTGSGLFIVNPPWQLKSKMDTILPFLLNKLGKDGACYTNKQLIDE